MKMFEFYDIDFDCLMVFIYGDNVVGLGLVIGNYFINMFFNGMVVYLESFVVKNCIFKCLVCGFICEQGFNYKIWDYVLIEDNQFFDCGYYSNGVGGYLWIVGFGNNVNFNLYKDFVVCGNIFYDCLFFLFFSEIKQSVWKGGVWNIMFENNILVNWNICVVGNIFNMCNILDGSIYMVKNNLIVLIKQDGDV